MSRVIRKSLQRSSTEAARLLAAVFTTELIAPSRCLWLVSPWISDIPMIDNRTDSFDVLRALGPREVRLSEVLTTLAEEGTTVVVGTTSDPTNLPFRQRLGRLFEEHGVSDRLVLDVDQTLALHEKAITGDDFVIAGSMNITNNGVFVREEFVELRTEREFVARSRMDAYERFGGVL